MTMPRGNSFGVPTPFSSGQLFRDATPATLAENLADEAKRIAELAKTRAKAAEGVLVPGPYVTDPVTGKDFTPALPTGAADPARALLVLADPRIQPVDDGTIETWIFNAYVSKIHNTWRHGDSELVYRLAAAAAGIGNDLPIRLKMALADAVIRVLGVGYEYPTPQAPPSPPRNSSVRRPCSPDPVAAQAAYHQAWMRIYSTGKPAMPTHWPRA